jgi:transcription elongation GreA/GreB family factor
MSRAFVKESEDAAGDLEFPERAVSAHRNLVTASGLAQIDAHLKRLDGELAAARAAADKPAVARCQRDLRYWQQRRASAELVVPGKTDGRVRFGSRVTVELGDGSRRSFRIVGEDEADPAAGAIAYVAPIAAAMIGAEPGERVPTGAGDGEIIDIG